MNPAASNKSPVEIASLTVAPESSLYPSSRREKCTLIVEEDARYRELLKEQKPLFKSYIHCAHWIIWIIGVIPLNI